ncbi:hypothetical protein [Ralstonia pickettii]|uniref:Transmembrane protein n=1 Tax=Ralstonia pickettii TaxID=329 RepID=A0AAW4QAG6_RALPI|nr:hypothetical protein [Ralstonia pickettii]MBA9846549.1 hypothetical protein [Ralstonia pickettii]MBA9851956.1 hypothetical protein [Ralstonia pickettii]MBA9919687.1 hypothetical protein [Ralstonia pickettii]MBA9958909.1 hypothetical protein [Ralstonia pickettii]MBA9965098.1 hypothetical protein [Ralstonia pickettii]
MGSNLAIYVVVLVCLVFVARYGMKRGKSKQEAIRAWAVLAGVAGIPIAAQVIGVVFHPFA